MELVEYRHPGTGFVLPVPSDWERVTDSHGTALIAAEPERGPWFRANVVVTVERLPVGTDLSAWHAQSVELLAANLERFLLIDTEVDNVDGRQVGRILGHHTTDVGAVAVELWLVAEHGVGYTLTASVGSLEYDEVADMFATVAAGLRPDPEYSPS